eukprot:469788-Karenia_brevis.AAC.1
MLKANVTTHGDGLLHRIKKFVNHVQQSSHLDSDFHAENNDILEEAFNSGQDEKRYLLFSHVSLRPHFLFASSSTAEGFKS